MNRVPVTLGAVDVAAADPQALAEFWGAVAGGITHASGGYGPLPAVGPDGFSVLRRRAPAGLRSIDDE